MKIIIFTSADHIYANLLLKDLIAKNLFSKHSLLVLEQDSIIPRKSKLQGLLKYLKTSGLNYMIAQIIKVYIFKVLQKLSILQSKKSSIYYPYYLNSLKKFKHKIMNNIKNKENIEIIKKQKPDLILSILSKEIIPDNIIKIPKLGCVNIHPAPLPFYRGVSPTFWVLANNEITSGVTLHYVDTKIDTGRIISQSKFSLKNIKTEHEVYIKSTYESIKLIEIFLGNAFNNKKIRTNKNPKNGSYYSLPTKTAVNAFYKNGYRFFNLIDMLRNY